LLLDYRLGDIPGDVVACKLKELNGVKIILISGYQLEEHMIRTLLERKCIVDTISKPIGLAKLRERLAHYANLQFNWG
jgi:DNA-binding response OmpR family regulator